MPDIFDEVAKEPKTVGGFLGNVLESGKKQITGLANMVMHPIDTYKAIEPVVQFAGGVGMANPSMMAKSAPKAKRFADALIEDYAKAYGSMDSAMETLYNDPFRVVGDAAMLAGGAGAAAKAANLPRVAKAAQTVERVANAVQPINLAMSAPGAIAKTAAKLLPESAPRGLYRAALQPGIMRPKPGTEGAERANQMLDLAVEGEYMPGVKAPVQQRMSELNAERVTALSNAHAAGKTIDPNSAIGRIDDLIADTAMSDDSGRKVAMLQGMKQRALAQYDDPANPGTMRKISPGEAEKIKEANYKQVNYATKGGLREQGLKQMARGWKEDLESLVPELKAINPEWAGLKDLYNEFDKFAQKAHGASPMQVGMAGAAGTVLSGGNPMAGMAAAGLREALSVPAIKAKLAFALKKAQREGYKGRGLGSATAPTFEVADILKQIDERDKAQQENK